MQEIGQKTLYKSQFIPPTNQSLLGRQILAIKNGRLDILHSISINFHEKDQHQKNLLFFAAYYKQPLIMLYLLRQGVDYRSVDNQQKTLYHVLAYSGSIQCTRLLRIFYRYEKIKRINQEYLTKLSALQFKRTDFKNGKLKFSVSKDRQTNFNKLRQQVTMMYQKYINQYLDELRTQLLSSQQKQSRNCMHLGCLNRFQKCIKVLQLLLQQANVINLNNDPQFNQQCQQVSAVLKKQFDPRFYQDTIQLIRQLISLNRLEQIDKEYKKNTHRLIKDILQSKDKNQHTPLYLASQNGSTSVINLLLKYQVKGKRNKQQAQDLIKIAPNNLARSHILELCNAPKLLDNKLTDFIITCGEEINKKKTIFGTFALLEAVKAFGQDNNLQSIKALLKSGANVNIQDTNGWTVLHHAADLGHKPIIQLLINGHNPKLNVMTNKDFHILHLAAMKDHDKIIELLLSNQKSKNKIKIDVIDTDGCTPLHLAAKKGSLKALKTLISLKADLYATDKFKNTVLHHAAINNEQKIIRELIQSDSDEQKLLSMKTSKGKVAKELCSDFSIRSVFENIYSAARIGDINLLRKVINANPKVKDNCTPKKEQTPLILSVINGKLLIVKYLIQNEADQYHEDKAYKKNAEDIAKQLLQKAKKDKNKQKYQIYKNIVALFAS